MAKIADNVISLCGGHRVVAEICGVNVSRVYRWTYAKKKGGTDGLIPAKYQAQLLEGAQARGIRLFPHDFFETSIPVGFDYAKAAEVST